MYVIQRKKATTYFVKYFGILPLSITLSCTINLMQKSKIHYKSYNNYKCHHRNKINDLPIKKLLTYLLNYNKRIEKNIRDNDSSDGTKQLLK